MVIGRSVTRRPVALNTAFAIAAGTPTMTSSPSPLTPIGSAMVSSAGRYSASSAGRRDLQLIDAEETLLHANGVNTDVELAIYEADHGSPAKAVALARRAWAEAPSVRAADALGWALAQDGQAREGLIWSHRALKLGSVDPLF